MNYNDREVELRRLAVLLRSGAVDMKHATGYEYEKLFALLDNLDAAIELPPPLHCACCGETENLVSGASASGDTIYLCQAAAREASAEKG